MASTGDRLDWLRSRKGLGGSWLLEQLGKWGDLLREGKLGEEKGQGCPSSSV